MYYLVFLCQVIEKSMILTPTPSFFFLHNEISMAISISFRGSWGLTFIHRSFDVMFFKLHVDKARLIMKANFEFHFQCVMLQF